MIDFFLTGVSRWPQGVISIWKWYVHRNIFGKAHVWKISQPSSEVFYPSMEKVWNSSFRRGKKINSYILYILLYLVVRNQGYESWKNQIFLEYRIHLFGRTPHNCYSAQAISFWVQPWVENENDGLEKSVKSLNFCTLMCVYESCVKHYC